MSEPTGERNRLSMIAELAIRERLKKRLIKPKPTIKELEDILNSGHCDVEILPDGQISTKEDCYPRDLGDAVLEAIYSDGWKIVEGKA